MHTEWRGDRGSPRFGPRARRWFALRLRDKLLGTVGYKEKRITDAEVGELVAWYLENAQSYVTWRPYQSFAGTERFLGEWVLNEARFAADFARGIADARRRIEANRFATLDEWLDDQRTTMATGFSLGTRDGGTGKLPEEVRWRLLCTARDRQKRWPVNCRDCGETFRWTGGRASKIRCAQCDAQRKGARSGARREATQ